MSNFAKGDSVVQVVTPVAGTVQGFQVDQETGSLQVLVGWTDAEGQEHARYFDESHIAVAPVAAPTA